MPTQVLNWNAGWIFRPGILYDWLKGASPPVEQLSEQGKMENTNLLDLIAGGVAIVILIGAGLLMNTTILTTKKK